MTDSITKFGTDLIVPLVNPGSRTFVPFLVLAMLIACVFHRVKGHEGGWRARFRGSGARVAFHAPQIGITMALFERCKAFFSRAPATAEG